MSTARCPLCRKRYTLSFLPLHASSCTPRPISKPRRRPRTPTPPVTLALSPRYRLSPPRTAPVSLTAAPGFHLFPAAFRALEPSLLSLAHATPPAWADFRFRLAKNYGPAYNLPQRCFLFGPSAPPRIPLPPYVEHSVLPVLRALTPVLAAFRPNQMAVGLYRGAAAHILPHNDCENGTIGTAVVGVCLGAACTITLILRARHSGVGKDVKKDVRLPRGACYVMSGDALRVWEHAIFPGRTEGDRVSLTLRDVAPRKDEGGAGGTEESLLAEHT